MDLGTTPWENIDRDSAESIIQAVEILCDDKWEYKDNNFYCQKQSTHGASVVSIKKPYSFDDLRYIFYWLQRPFVEVFRCTRDGYCEAFRQGAWIQELIKLSEEIAKEREKQAELEAKMKFTPIKNNSFLSKLKNKE